MKQYYKMYLGKAGDKKYGQGNGLMPGLDFFA